MDISAYNSTYRPGREKRLSLLNSVQICNSVPTGLRAPVISRVLHAVDSSDHWPTNILRIQVRPIDANPPE